VFFDETNGYNLWSDSGCSTATSNTGGIVCTCTHTGTIAGAALVFPVPTTPGTSNGTTPPSSQPTNVGTTADASTSTTSIIIAVVVPVGVLGILVVLFLLYRNRNKGDEFVGKGDDMTERSSSSLVHGSFMLGRRRTLDADRRMSELIELGVNTSGVPNYDDNAAAAYGLEKQQPVGY